MNLFIPEIPEQKRIASFFTEIDKKISELKQKKNLLEQYKKGVIQKIFSQEFRFKDEKGNAYPKWEKKKLEEVVKIIMGQSPRSKSYNSEGKGIPLIQGKADIQNRLSNPRNWTTEKTKECLKGDLILTVRAPVGNVAKSIHNACIGRGVCAIRNNSNINIEYIYQFLLDYETKWIKIEQGSTFTAVSGIEIKKLGIKIPSLTEQTKIANFLSALDNKINHTQTQIEKTENWKKGLLQKMFC
jgi:type I restriction enzyme S subunit